MDWRASQKWPAHLLGHQLSPTTSGSKSSSSSNLNQNQNSNSKKSVNLLLFAYWRPQQWPPPLAGISAEPKAILWVQAGGQSRARSRSINNNNKGNDK